MATWRCKWIPGRVDPHASLRDGFPSQLLIMTYMRQQLVGRPTLLAGRRSGLAGSLRVRAAPCCAPARAAGLPGPGQLHRACQQRPWRAPCS
eukprot:465102-Pelagomonas_calceolata.AAC.7